MGDTTLLDRASAEKALKALSDDAIHGEALKAALANVLARKLGQTAPALPTGTRMPDKFERFFDILFNVAFEHKPLPIERVIALFQKAADTFRRRAQEDREMVHEDPDDDASAAYDEDAVAYERVVAMLKSGDHKAAVRHYRQMDTYTRGMMFSNDPREEYELNVFLDQNGY